MQIISQFAPLPLAQPAKGTAVAMGYFDGIHIGHRAVIEGAVQWAKAHDAAPAVFTFRLPVENKMKGKRLLSTEDKHALIHSPGVEYYLTPDFEAIKALSPRSSCAASWKTATPGRCSAAKTSPLAQKLPVRRSCCAPSVPPLG